jgi:hypothetical protein
MSTIRHKQPSLEQVLRHLGVYYYWKRDAMSLGYKSDVIRNMRRRRTNYGGSIIFFNGTKYWGYWSNYCDILVYFEGNIRKYKWTVLESLRYLNDTYKLLPRNI